MKNLRILSEGLVEHKLYLLQYRIESLKKIKAVSYKGDQVKEFHMTWDKKQMPW